MLGKRSPIPAILLFVVLVIVAFKLGVPFKECLQGLLQFVTGGAKDIHLQRPGALDLMKHLLAFTLICFPVIIGMYALVGLTFGRPEVEEQVEEIKGGKTSAKTLFILVLFEEVLARALFLGFFAKFWNSPVWFYLMFLAGNGIWALLHLGNFKKASIVNVLPQFAGGIIFSYIFVRWGFFAAVLVHFSYDAILFALSKREELDVKDLVYAVYYGLVAFFSWGWLRAHGVGIEALKPWTDSYQLRTVSIGVLDVLACILLLNALGELILGGLCCMDKNQPLSKDVEMKHVVAGVIFSYPIGMLAVLFVRLLGWLLGFVMAGPVGVAIVLATWSSLITTKSVNSWTRKWFAGLPATYLTTCAALTLGFWAASLVYAGLIVVEVIPMLIRHAESEELD